MKTSRTRLSATAARCASARRISRKAIAQGIVRSCAAFFDAHRTRDRGCSAHPVFPAPSVFRGQGFQLRAHRAGRMRSRIDPPSLRAQRSNPSRRKGSLDCFAALANDGEGRRSPGTTTQASTVLLSRTLHEPTSTGQPRGNRAQRPARMANAGADRTGRALAWTECRILQCSKFGRMAPAKGAMAIQSASLYWCGWHTSFGTESSRPAKIAREETCVH
jgi:hypothetical protein